MALKIVHLSDISNLVQTPTDSPPRHLKGCIQNEGCVKHDTLSSFQLPKKFLVMGHRGSGMNLVQSSDPRMKLIRENSIRAFNTAKRFNVDFIEFDVQVTKDGYPVIFHDISILSQENGVMSEKKITNINLQEFLSYGPQKEPLKMGKPIFRKSKDGRIFEWKVAEEDHFCTLQQAFQEVEPTLGFNIELKFDNNVIYKQEQLIRALKLVLQVVFEHAGDRPIIFSSFHPDAVLLIKNLQSTHPVYFLTNGGSEIYPDVRRNSLDEALNLCLQSGLQGIVSEVKAILRNPAVTKKIKESNLSLITYGQFNNVPEVVYMQYLLGIEGVIVDLVKEITEIAPKFHQEAMENRELTFEGIINQTLCSNDENSSFIRLIPELLNVSN